MATVDEYFRIIVECDDEEVDEKVFNRSPGFASFLFGQAIRDKRYDVLCVLLKRPNPYVVPNFPFANKDDEPIVGFDECRIIHLLRTLNPLLNLENVFKNKENIRQYELYANKQVVPINDIKRTYLTQKEKAIFGAVVCGAISFLIFVVSLCV